MTIIKRRTFIKYAATSAAAMAAAYKIPAPSAKAAKLSFSTLGCPQWDLPTIINFAAANKYQGIEIRVIAGEMDLPNYTAFSDVNIAATKRMIKDKNLNIVDIGTSAQMHHTDKATIEKHIDDAKKFIDLSAKLDCKYVRVFPEKLLTGEQRLKSLDIIITNLKLLGDYAKGSGVKVLLETHGDLVRMDDLHYVMHNTENSNVGLIWDFLNMWAVTKESTTEVFQKLSKYIFHVHVKDATFNDNKLSYVLIGKGTAPVKEAIQQLHKNNYKGYYSFEWEKQWHPEIEEPEIALAAYPGTMKQYFSGS